MTEFQKTVITVVEEDRRINEDNRAVHSRAILNDRATVVRLSLSLSLSLSSGSPLCSTSNLPKAAAGFARRYATPADDETTRRDGYIAAHGARGMRPFQGFAMSF